MFTRRVPFVFRLFSLVFVMVGSINYVEAIFYCY